MFCICIALRYITRAHSDEAHRTITAA
ncbi:hypothetical protein ANCCAN_14125 [Ancylostoma caninum]|uniref:Uncharacterized protein n=1 Tax=Ancylostoma caninum TaxID=29170 RepID=A0A368G695_ANCCA|nr:hypothetical protein ANCCAN_14125 [Ancylostoma caninum]